MRLGSSALCIWDRHPGLVGVGDLSSQFPEHCHAPSCSVIMFDELFLESCEDSNTEQGPQWDCHEHHIGSCFNPSLDVGWSDGLVRGDLWPHPRSAEDGAIGPRKPGSTANLAKRWRGSECIGYRNTQMQSWQSSRQRFQECFHARSLHAAAVDFTRPRAIQNHRIYSCKKASCLPCNLL